MATAGRAWNAQTVANATATQILSSPEGGIEEFVIRCDIASAAGLRVNVRSRANSIHAEYASGTATTYFKLAAGESITFAASLDNRINSIIVDGDGGTATFSGTVTKA